MSEPTSPELSPADKLPKKSKWLKNKLARTQELVMKDHLTGLPNRKWFDEELNRKHAEARREDKSLWVIMMDIDLFKKINDEHGHGVGDEILKEFGHIGAREEEPPARIGGEEFAQALSAEMTMQDVQKLLSRYSSNFKERSKAILGREATLSFGVARLEPGESHEDLLARADSALYQSKKTGRNKGTFLSGRLEGGFYSTISLLPTAQPLQSRNT